MAGGERVVVLMGGQSGEHDVSLMSGSAVAGSLPEAGYDPVPVVVTRDGRFVFPGKGGKGGTPVGLWEAVRRIEALRPACVFPAMHGPFGEDGRIQSLCDLMHLPCVGSDPIGSGVAMDKALAKAVYQASGIPTPPWTVIDFRALSADPGTELSRIEKAVGLPCVVKPARLGSSVDMGLAHDERELAELALLCKAHGRVMCEQYRPGMELTVPVLEDAETGKPRALPVIEIVVKKEPGGLFDYESKYDPELADEICPARIGRDLAAKVSGLAELAHTALALSGFSRTDFMVDDHGAWTLETNTIPGLTPVSLFPKAAEAASMSYADLLNTLVRGAIRRFQEERNTGSNAS